MAANLRDKSMLDLWADSYLDGGNAAYLEEVYEQYLEDPNSVATEWKDFFTQLPSANNLSKDIPHSEIKDHFRDITGKVSSAANTDDGNVEYERKQVRVLQLIQAYRARGHQHAKINPLATDTEKPHIADLTLEHHKLSNADLNTVFANGSLYGPETATLKEILDILTDTYCGSIASEYSHIVESEERVWVQQRIESVRAKPNFDKDKKLEVLKNITAGEGLEKYLHTKYVGQKRFSLEGGESLIPMLQEMIQRGGANGQKEVVIAMAHRGRLNVLVNIMGKIPGELFSEFEGKSTAVEGDKSSDVKYHMGFSSDVKTPGGTTHLALAFNPSHLEIVAPVAEGSVRARQDRRGDTQGEQVMPIIIHGDAAFAGQGVVMETFNMSQSRGYSTKGTVHIVVNNQVGFTTSNQKDSRSTLYCTDVAKMVNAPIFHVNGDDPEAVVLVSQIALDYRLKFKKDVVIDLVCYRRHGHNEADEPSATQPMMYQVIKKLPTTRKLYADKLIAEGTVSANDVKAITDSYRAKMDAGECVQEYISTMSEEEKQFVPDWKPFLNNQGWTTPYESHISLEQLQALTEKLTTLPEGVKAHNRVAKILEDRKKMAAGSIPLDWGFAETMAYASLVTEGTPVRLSGQDCGRGTFFHRHAVIHDQNGGDPFIPLRNLSDDQANYLVIDSLLSEEAVLGFEYGYATSDPYSLVIWEAQFGDFVNGAQVVIDQFISSGEQKWGRLCALTMLLPHGFEGQGPEHSSARLERFLQLCAQHNMQVCVPSTPAQCFHMLRRQVIRPWRAPLIVMSPKSLLRHKSAVNSLEDLTSGRFYNVLDDKVEDKDKVTHIILCSGKVFYDLDAYRQENNRHDVAILRMEQLYPFPEKELAENLATYKNLKTAVWCQEEPMNQGAWYTSQHHIRRVLGATYLGYAGREASASPAVGMASVHNQQQKALVEQAFANDK